MVAQLGSGENAARRDPSLVESHGVEQRQYVGTRIVVRLQRQGRQRGVERSGQS
jgi:hypothetical protein